MLAHVNLCAVAEKRGVGIALRMEGDIMPIRTSERFLRFKQRMSGTADTMVL